MILEILLITTRINKLKQELVSFYNLNQMGSEWLLTNMDEIISFFEEKHIITHG